LAIGSFWTLLQTALGVFIVYLMERNVTAADLMAAFVIALIGTGLFVLLTHLPIWKRASASEAGSVSISGNVAGGNQLIQRLLGLINVNVNVHPTTKEEEAKPKERRTKTHGRRTSDTPSPTPPSPLNRIQFVRVESDFALEANGDPLYRVTQVWFQNADKHKVASISAEIIVKGPSDRFWRKDVGAWAIGTLPENVGNWTELRHSIDLAPGEIGKLNVFRRYVRPRSLECFMFADGETQDQDRIVFGKDLRVSIELNGVGVDRTFQFNLLNDGPRFALLFKV
jgi:hypothetical protein